VDTARTEIEFLNPSGRKSPMEPMSALLQLQHMAVACRSDREHRLDIALAIHLTN